MKKNKHTRSKYYWNKHTWDETIAKIMKKNKHTRSKYHRNKHTCDKNIAKITKKNKHTRSKYYQKKTHMRWKYCRRRRRTNTHEMKKLPTNTLHHQISLRMRWSSFNLSHWSGTIIIIISTTTSGSYPKFFIGEILQLLRSSPNTFFATY